MTQVAGFASLNGADPFGFVMSWSNPPNPVDRALTAYPGVEGLQAVRLGSRGGRSEVVGAWVGPDFATIAAFEALALQYQQVGLAYTCIDIFGNVWPNVILEQYQPDGRILYVTSGGGGVAKLYRMSLLHLGG